MGIFEPQDLIFDLGFGVFILLMFAGMYYSFAIQRKAVRTQDYAVRTQDVALQLMGDSQRTQEESLSVQREILATLKEISGELSRETRPVT